MKTAHESRVVTRSQGVSKFIRKAIKQAAKNGLYEVEVYSSFLEPFTEQDTLNLARLGYVIEFHPLKPHWRTVRWAPTT